MGAKKSVERPSDVKGWPKARPKPPLAAEGPSKPASPET